MNSQAGPDAIEQRTRLIVKWHARGHDALDTYGIPRFKDGMEYTIEERVDLLAQEGDVKRTPYFRPIGPGTTKARPKPG